MLHRRTDPSLKVLQAVLIAAFALSSACHGGESGKPSGASCSSDSECDEPLLCQYGRCRSECTVDRECGEGVCVEVEDQSGARVCTVLEEVGCETDHDCPVPLVCGDDRQCRNACDRDNPCAEGLSCVDRVCVSSACGDGIVVEPEQCDEGELNNSDTEPDACRSDCTSPRCGDGVADTGEECDDGDDNNDLQADACRRSCSSAICGDGVIDTGEHCDDGEENNDEELGACPTTCVHGSCEPGEERCEGDNHQRCNDDGRWERVETCPGLCLVDACLPFIPSNIDAEHLYLFTAGEGNLVISEDVTIDTDTGAIFGETTVMRDAGEGMVDGIGFSIISQGLGERDLGVFSVVGLAVDRSALVTVRGSLALVVLVRGDVRIDGVVEALGQTGGDGSGIPGVGGAGGFDGGDASAGGGDGNGPGRGLASGADPGATGGDGGGGGAGFCGEGGGGGEGRDGLGGGGGDTYGNPSLVPLVGGSGGASGEPAPDTGGGGGAGGGGAVQIGATGLVQINGGVNAGGGGGGGGGGSENGAGGAGSGGAVLIEGAQVVISGCVAANGGSGGSQDAGGRGRLSAGRAFPAAEEGFIGRGGGGSNGSTIDGGAGTSSTGGGSGGGGAGRIRINAPDPNSNVAITPGAVISPRPSPVTPCATIGTPPTSGEPEEGEER